MTYYDFLGYALVTAGTIMAICLGFFLVVWAVTDFFDL